MGSICDIVVAAVAVRLGSIWALADCGVSHNAAESDNAATSSVRAERVGVEHAVRGE
jgi:hypothetical protein